MKRTNLLSLPYLERGDALYEGDEQQRWGALDLNLYGVAKTCDSGVIDTGWALSDGGADTLALSAGEALIDGLYVTTGSTTVDVGHTEGTYYLYAVREDPTTAPAAGSYAVTFEARDTKAYTGRDIFLGSFHVDNAGAITGIDATLRDTSAFAKRAKQEMLDLLRLHVHSTPPGTTPVTEPKQVDIGLDLNATQPGSGPKILKEATGVLPVENIGSINVSGLSGEFDATNVPAFSHIGRVKETALPKRTPLYTTDYIHYKTGETPVSGVTPVVFVNDAVAAEPWAWDEASATVTFTTRTPATAATEHLLDQVAVYLDRATYYPVKGRWNKPSDITLDTDYVHVYVNGQEVSGWTAHSPGGAAIYDAITLPEQHPLTDVVTVTLRGVYVTGIGKTDHPDLDDPVEQVNAFGEMDRARLENANAMALSEYLHTELSTEHWHQFEPMHLPDDWFTYIDDDASTVHPYNQKHYLHWSNPVGAGDSSEPLSDGRARAQTFRTRHGNVWDVTLWLSKAGAPEVQHTDFAVTVDLYAVDAVTGLPTTPVNADLAYAPLTIPAATIAALDEGAHAVTVTFNWPHMLVDPDAVYALVVTQNQATDADNCVLWHTTSDGRYLKGKSAYVGGDAAWHNGGQWTDYSFRACYYNDGRVLPGNPGCGEGDFNATNADPLYQSFALVANSLWYVDLSLSVAALGTSAPLTLGLYALDETGTPTGGPLTVATHVYKDWGLDTQAAITTSADLLTSARCYRFFFGEPPIGGATGSAYKTPVGRYALGLATGEAGVRWHGRTGNPYDGGAAYKTVAGLVTPVGDGYDFFFDPTATNQTDTSDGGGGDHPKVPVKLPGSSSYTATLLNTHKVTNLWLSRAGENTGYLVVAELYKADGSDDPIGFDEADPDTGWLKQEVVAAASDIPRDHKPFMAAFDPALPTDLGAKYCVVLRAYPTDTALLGGLDADNYPVWWVDAVDYPDGKGRQYNTTTHLWGVIPDDDPDDGFAITDTTDFTFKIWGLEGERPPGQIVDEDFSLGGLTVASDPLISIIIDQTGSNGGYSPDPNFVYGSLKTDPCGLRFYYVSGVTPPADRQVQPVGGSCAYVGTGLLDDILAVYPNADFDILAMADETNSESTLTQSGWTYEKYAFPGGSTDANKGAVYAMLGDTTNITGDGPTLKAAVTAIRESVGLSGDTSLLGAIRVAARRLKDANDQFIANNPDRPEGRKMSIIVLTDGGEVYPPDFAVNGATGTSRVDDVQDELTKNGGVSLFVAMYGFSDNPIDMQDRLTRALAPITYATGGRYFLTNDIATNMPTILAAIKGLAGWKSRTTLKEKSFDRVVRLKGLRLNGSIPGGSTAWASVDLYLFGAGGGTLTFAPDGSVRATGDLVAAHTPEGAYALNVPMLDEAGQPTVVLFDPEVEVTKIGFCIHLTAGSTPTLDSVGITYADPVDDYIYTLPIPTPLPLHQARVNMPDHAPPPGVSWQFGVFNGKATYWPSFTPLRDNVIEMLPGRINEPLAPDNAKQVYTAKNGPWSGEYRAIVAVNGAYIAHTQYTARPSEGTIHFASPQTHTNLTLTLVPMHWFRVAARLRYPGGPAPLETFLSFMWALRPPGL